MNSEDKLLFNHQGYIILRDVISHDKVAVMNAIADRKAPAKATFTCQQCEFFVCKWGQEFLDLVDEPTVIPWIEYLCGKKFRLDHDYGIFMNPGSPGSRLHGGEPEFSDFWYRSNPQGEYISGLTVVTYFLTDAPDGSGGFVCIPGSHRGNFIADIPADVLYQKRLPSYVVQPSFRAGDVVIFCEGLIHGTAAWNATHQRRVLLYKYTPGHMAWIGNFYQPNEFERLTPQQRDIMRPPYVEMIRHPNGDYRTDTLADQKASSALSSTTERYA